MQSALSCYPYFLYVISVSTVSFNSDITNIRLLTCGNGEQWCPLAAFTDWQYFAKCVTGIY